MIIFVRDVLANAFATQNPISYDLSSFVISSCTSRNMCRWMDIIASPFLSITSFVFTSFVSITWNIISKIIHRSLHSLSGGFSTESVQLCIYSVVVLPRKRRDTIILENFSTTPCRLFLFHDHKKKITKIINGDKGGGSRPLGPPPPPP